MKRARPAFSPLPAGRQPARERVAEFVELDEVFAALDALDAADARPRGGNGSPLDPAAERDANEPPDGS